MKTLKNKIQRVVTSGHPDEKPSDSVSITIPRFPKRKNMEMPAPFCKRDERGRILPGSTANPTGVGRAQALSRVAAELTGGGEEMMGLLVLIARGELETTVVTAKGELVEVPPTIKERMEAADRVLDRLAGKAPALIGVDTGNAPQGDVPRLEDMPLSVKIKMLEAANEFHRVASERTEEKQDVIDVTPTLPAQ